MRYAKTTYAFSEATCATLFPCRSAAIWNSRSFSSWALLSPKTASMSSRLLFRVSGTMKSAKQNARRQKAAKKMYLAGNQQEWRRRLTWTRAYCLRAV